METYRADRRHVDMLDALLRLDLRVDPRSRSRRRRSCLVLGAGARRAVGVLAGHCRWAAFTMRLGLPPRRRSRATVCIETRARGAFSLVAVEARSWAAFVGHACAWWQCSNWGSQRSGRGLAVLCKSTTAGCVAAHRLARSPLAPPVAARCPPHVPITAGRPRRVNHKFWALWGSRSVHCSPPSNIAVPTHLSTPSPNSLHPG